MKIRKIRMRPKPVHWVLSKSDSWRGLINPLKYMIKFSESRRYSFGPCYYISLMVKK